MKEKRNLFSFATKLLNEGTLNDNPDPDNNLRIHELAMAKIVETIARDSMMENIDDPANFDEEAFQAKLKENAKNVLKEIAKKTIEANKALTENEMVAEDQKVWASSELGLGLPVTDHPTNFLIYKMAQKAVEVLDDLREELGDAAVDGADFLKELLTFGEEKLNELSNKVNETFTDIGGIPRTISDLFQDALDLFVDALNFQVNRHDPLTLDLDGDGLELSALEGSNTFFDLDNNGFAGQTAWVGADDGLLVLDRDGNGTIDNGSELFGDATPINGGTGTAADGFAALSDLDSNAGVIDANDAQFADLRVWQDLNQNGFSEAGELSTLSDLNITSIDLNDSASSQVINGNSLPLVSTFTRGDRSTHFKNTSRDLMQRAA